MDMRETYVRRGHWYDKDLPGRKPEGPGKIILINQLVKIPLSLTIFQRSAL